MAEKQSTVQEKVHTLLEALSTGELSLREETPDIAEMAAEDLPPGPEGDYGHFLPISPLSLAENIQQNPNYLRECFGYMLMTMSEAYDSLDHQNSPDYFGTDLQDDCRKVRELASSFTISDSKPA